MKQLHDNIVFGPLKSKLEHSLGALPNGTPKFMETWERFKPLKRTLYWNLADEIMEVTYERTYNSYQSIDT